MLRHSRNKKATPKRTSATHHNNKIKKLPKTPNKVHTAAFTTAKPRSAARRNVAASSGKNLVSQQKAFLTTMNSAPLTKAMATTTTTPTFATTAVQSFPTFTQSHHAPHFFNHIHNFHIHNFSTQAEKIATTTTTTATSTTTAADTTTDAQADPNAKPKGVKAIIKKYGKTAVYAYFGIYFAFLGTLTLAFTTIPALDANAMIDWAVGTGHIDKPVAFFNTFLDKFPIIGNPIRANKESFTSFAGAWCTCKFTEPIRIPLTLFVAKWWSDKKALAKQAEQAGDVVRQEEQQQQQQQQEQKKE